MTRGVAVLIGLRCRLASAIEAETSAGTAWAANTGADADDINKAVAAARTILLLIRFSPCFVAAPYSSRDCPPSFLWFGGQCPGCGLRSVLVALRRTLS